MQWWSCRTSSWLYEFLVLEPQLEKSHSAGMVGGWRRQENKRGVGLSSLQQVLESKVRSQTHLGGFEMDVKLMSLIELD